LIFRLAAVRHDTIRQILLLVVFSCAGNLILVAQNLVPNGNFEEDEHGLVLNWQQPVNMYYHYEKRWVKRDRMRLESINGICLVSPGETEYLQVELKQPLKSGETYTLQLELMRSLKDKVWSESYPDAVHIHFSDTPFDVSTRVLISAQAHISLDLNKVQEPETFYTYTQTYIASGNEKFMLIGRLINPVNTENSNLYFYYNEGKKKALDIAQTVYNHQTLYMPSSEWGTSKNKQYRRYKKQVRKMDKWYRQQVDSIHNVFDPILDTLVEPVKYNSYDTRYYFDNISLVPENAYAEYATQHDSLMNHEPELKTDVTYTLQNVVFETDKSVLLPQSLDELNSIADIMQRYSELSIHLTGHTDSINTEAYNQKLSAERAKACALYLIEKGVTKSRVTYEGKGEAQPLVPNDTEEGRQMNRRVEFVFRKRE